MGKWHPYFKIQTKEHGSQLFQPKRAQIHYQKHKTNKDLIVKARQLGFTTMIKLDDLNAMMSERDMKCVTIADTLPNAQEIFGKVEYAFDNLEPGIQSLFSLDTNNISKMSFGANNTSLRVTTSARSGTAQRLHVSEFANMSESKQAEVIEGSIEAVPRNGYIAIESTTRGRDKFFEMCEEARLHKSDYKVHFYNWVWDDEYEIEPPNNDSWMDDYRELAKLYTLIRDVDTKFKLSPAKFYWYYLKALKLKEKVKQEYPTTYKEAFLARSNNVFNLELLDRIQTASPTEVLENGDLRIWKDPVLGHVYVIGVDTSEGDINSDYQVAQVIDVNTNEQVATLHCRVKDSDFALLLNDLGLLYNEALIAVERNNHGHSVINSLTNTQKYKKLYVAEDEKIGWLTTGASKPLMLTGSDGLVDVVEKQLLKVYDLSFIQEAEVFEYKDQKSNMMGARDGERGKRYFDDRVMALAIAWRCRVQALASKRIGVA